MFKKFFCVFVCGTGVIIILTGNIYSSVYSRVRIVKSNPPSIEIISTGIGYPPNRNMPSAKKHLLAQRAATIDAYRILLSVVKGLSDSVTSGPGYIYTSGYIKGAVITQVREFINGKVEVDLSLSVKVKSAGNENTIYDKLIEGLSKKGYPVYYSREQRKEITDDEWQKLITMKK